MPNILHEDLESEPWDEDQRREQAISELPKFHRFAYRTGELWRKRPDVFTMHFYYIPIALTVGAFTVGAVDQEFHLHLAKDMAADHATRRFPGAYF